MDSGERKIIRAAFSWYRFILRSKDELSRPEKDLFNAIASLELENKKELPTSQLYPVVDSKDIIPYKEHDRYRKRPTIPDVLESALLDEEDGNDDWKSGNTSKGSDE